MSSASKKPEDQTVEEWLADYERQEARHRLRAQRQKDEGLTEEGGEGQGDTADQYTVGGDL